MELYSLPLQQLGALADRRRRLAKADDYDGQGNDIVTYIVDRNINYTNVCNVYCKFCAFWRSEKQDDSYVITHDEIDKKIEETVALGGTQILMQGGHHPKLDKQWYLDDRVGGAFGVVAAGPNDALVRRDHSHLLRLMLAINLAT